MKNNKYMVMWFVVVVALLFGAALWSCDTKNDQYLSYPEYNGYTGHSQYVPMSDSVKLAVTWYLPSGGSSEKPFPVLFSYLPYHGESIDPQTGEIKMNYNQESMDLYTSYGYAMVFADFRGSGASFGSHINMDPQIAKDGKELIDWIAEQSWCDGNVGMIGGSYYAWSQFAVAGEKPGALKCIVPASTHFDAYSSGKFYPGGIYNKGLAFIMGILYPRYDKNLLVPGKAYPATPIVDEDGDGELADEIPIMNESGSFLDDIYQLPDNPPQYSDGETRQHVYYKATMEHLSNTGFNIGGPQGLLFRDAVGAGGYTFPELSPLRSPSAIAESGIPVYNIGGWFDYYARSTFQWHSTLSEVTFSKLKMLPINHSAMGLRNVYNGPYLEYFGLDKAVLDSEFRIDILRFADRYLKGIKNGFDKEPPVSIFVMNGEGWRDENEWPLARQITTSMYFEENNTLSVIPETEGSDNYKADFTHDSRQESSGANRWSLGKQDHVDIRNEKDLQCLTYTSAPLKSDVEVTGHPVVHLLVSSTADYGDFFVYLEDVDENGDAYFVTDGMHRAGFADLIPNEDILLPSDEGLDADIDVLPELPWHGYKEEDYTDRIFADNNIAKVVFDLMPTSWVFREGHQIRISIACADWPTFALHPELSPTNDPADPDNIIPEITVHREFDHRSYVELPVIPSKKLNNKKAEKWLMEHFSDIPVGN